VDIAATNETLSHSAPAPQAAPSSERREPFERRRVLSAAVDIASPEQIIVHLTECIAARRGCSVVGISAPYATAMRDDASLRDAFLKADLLIPDGKGFAWGARLLGVPCGERIAVPDLCERLLEIGNEKQWKVFIYGATDELNAKACANVCARFGGLSAVEGRHGYNQSEADEDSLIEYLKTNEFNLLIVARPSPDKEKFLARCCGEAGVVGIAAGGYADILAGITKRAPGFVQALGMEWLYRVAQEPGRLWKRIGWANVRFAAAVSWAHLRSPAGRPWWGNRALHVLGIVLALTVAYVGSLNAPYHFDDPEYIQENPTIRSFAALSDIKVLGFRKLWWMSNAICYKLSEWFGNHQIDKPDVRIFRAWNIGCHLIAALALFGILRRVLRASGKVAPGEEGAGSHYDLAAFVAAAVFAAHPLCTESVTYISGRDNGQGGMFYLLGLYAAAITFERMGLGRGAAKRREQSTIQWPSWFWPATLMLGFGACAVLTKESHLTFPAAVVLIYLFFYRGGRAISISFGLLIGILLAMMALAWGGASRRDGNLGLAFQLMLFFTVAGGLLGMRRDNQPRTNGPRRMFQERIGLTWAFLITMAGTGAAAIIAFPYAYQRTIGALTGYLGGNYIRSLATQAYAVPWMLGRGIVPIELNIDHDFPPVTDFSDPRAKIGAAIIVALVLFGIIGAWRRWLGAFGVLLALLYIAPSNSIIERGDVVSERNFYLVAAGAACFIAWIVAGVSGWLGAHMALSDRPDPTGRNKLSEAGLWAGVLGCCVAGPFTSLTLLRNNEWGDAYRLWESARRHSPDKLRVLFNYGIASWGRARRAQDDDTRLKYLEEADNAFTNVIKIGEWKAEHNLFRPDETVQVKCFHLAYANLAMMQLNRYMKSRKNDDYTGLNRVDGTFKNGIERTIHDPDLCYSYSSFLMQLGRFTDAAQVLQRSFDLHTWAEVLYYPLGLAYLECGKFDQGIQFFSMALNVQEQHTVGYSWAMAPEKQAPIYAGRGLTHVHLKQREQAVADFTAAMKFQHEIINELLLTYTKMRNPKLKPRETNPPDVFVMAMSVTRRDVLECLVLAADNAFKEKPSLERTALKSLRNAMDAELKRRGAIQTKRRAFGFMDDPDAD